MEPTRKKLLDPFTANAFKKPVLSEEFIHVPPSGL